MTQIFLKKEYNPHVVLVFYTTMQNLKKKIKKIFDLSSLTKEAQMKGARHMEEVTKFNKIINENFGEMEEDRKEKIKTNFGTKK